MTLGRQLRPDKAVLAAHTWVRAVLSRAVERNFPTEGQRNVYNEAALAQIKSIILDVIESFEPPAPRRADWD